MAFSEKQLIWISILPSIGAAISIIFSLKLVVTVLQSEYFRSRVYQRLMVGCAVNIIIQSVGMLWGPFAVPAGTPDFPYAKGTVTTCSARGFLDQLVIVVPIYFIAIYTMAYYAVRNKFQIQQHQWIEKWIHVFAYAFAVLPSFYILSVDGFNPVVRGCGLASLPLGCGDKSDDGVECTRGPQNIADLQWYFIGLPSFVTVGLPSLMMLVMYCRLRGQEVAMSVLRQSAIFFFAGIYWTFFFTALDYALIFAWGYVFAVCNILANTIRSLQGVWVYAVYWYFRSQDPTAQQQQEGEERDKTTKSRLSSALGDTISRRFSLPRPEFISRPDFSIFDGTEVEVSDSPWSRFLIYEGEDASYQEDCEYDDTDFDFSERERSGEVGCIRLQTMPDVVGEGPRTQNIPGTVGCIRTKRTAGEEAGCLQTHKISFDDTDSTDEMLPI